MEVRYLPMFLALAPASGVAVQLGDVGEVQHPRGGRRTFEELETANGTIRHADP
jgi:hypothetical protein